MLVPSPPTVTSLRQLTPSLYEVGLKCAARLSWSASAGRQSIPQRPSALLGTAFHAVVESANRGQLPSETQARRAAAREQFDTVAGAQYAAAHPLLRAKFASPQLLPYYNLLRERASMLSISTSVGVQRGSIASTGGAAIAREVQPAGTTERRLTSRDGVLTGRPDRLDLQDGEVIDYKTGSVSTDMGTAISGAELRQLRLYVYLARENGFPVSRGTIIRGTGGRLSQDIAAPEAEAEGQEARSVLTRFNAAASGATFESLARPSASACANCPCIPFCNSFWVASSAQWADESGIHAEGRVLALRPLDTLHGRVVTVEIEILRGTAPAGRGSLEQLPLAWLLESAAELREGGLIRVVDVKNASETGPAVLRVSKLSSAVWLVGNDSNRSRNQENPNG